MKNSLGKVVRTGNFDLLKFMMKVTEKDGGYGFNKLHTSAMY
jgi:hypothetical protein